MVALSLPERDPELERLSTEATAARKAKDWPRAITAVRSIERILRSSPEGNYPIEVWLRLPLFLAESGDWITAKTQFVRLLNDERLLGPWAGPKWSQRATICDKMRLSLQRLKMSKAAVVACALFIVCVKRADVLHQQEEIECASDDFQEWASEHIAEACKKAKIAQVSLPDVVGFDGTSDPDLHAIAITVGYVVGAECAIL